MRDSWWFASSLSYLALVSHLRGGSARATALYEESMDLFREQGDKQSLAGGLNNLAMLVYSQGDLRRAAELIEEAIALQGSWITEQASLLDSTTWDGCPAPRRSQQGY
jgi:Flp pilus assembly protein TadD